MLDHRYPPCSIQRAATQDTISTQRVRGEDNHKINDVRMGGWTTVTINGGRETVNGVNEG